MNRYGVLHIDLGKSFRGGQRQVFNLVRYLRENGVDTGCVAAAGGELEKRLVEINVPVFPVKYSGMDVVAESIRLRKVCTEMGYNILHAHDSHGHNIALTMKFVNPGLKAVVSRRVLSSKSRPLLSGWKYRSRNTDLFIAVSSVVEEQLLSWGVSDGRVVHIPSGVDLNSFSKVDSESFKKRHSIPDCSYYIGTASALDDNKDVATVINMIARLSYDRDDFMLLIAGTGEGKSELQRLAEFIEVEDKTRFLGHIDDMPQFFSMLDIYILSSRSEGLGTSLIEAGACGCPLIASDCGGPKDFIEHGRTGFLFPIEDDKELHSIVGGLLDNPQERESVTTCFAETIDHYSIETVCGEIVNQYNRLALLTG